MSKEKTGIEVEVILSEIESPVHDLSDAKNIYDRIKRIETKEVAMKKKLLAALNIAISKQ